MSYRIVIQPILNEHNASRAMRLTLCAHSEEVHYRVIITFKYKFNVWVGKYVHVQRIYYYFWCASAIKWDAKINYILYCGKFSYMLVRVYVRVPFATIFSLSICYICHYRLRKIAFLRVRNNLPILCVFQRQRACFKTVILTRIVTGQSIWRVDIENIGIIYF